MHPVTRVIIVQEGGRMYHSMHGKVHNKLEYSPAAVHLEITEERACTRYGLGIGGVWR